MDKSTVKAKHYLVINVASNVVQVIVNAGINLWMTPFLIKHLGIGVYGMIPLVISFTSYLNIFTMSVSESIVKHVAIAIGKEDYDEGNIYFNTGLLSLIAVSVVFLGPIWLFSNNLEHFFNIPCNALNDTRTMCFWILVSSMIMICRAPYRVSAIISHRFDLYNIVEISSKIIRIVLLIILFTYVQKSLSSFAISYFGMAGTGFIGVYILHRILTPRLKMKPIAFRLSALYEVSNMSMWLAVNQLGSLLYLSVSYILINIVLGPEELGKFGLVTVWVILLGTVTAAISNVFVPIAYNYISRNKSDLLAKHMSLCVKLMTLSIGFIITILCGFAKPILSLWLGEEYEYLSPLVWVMIAPWLVTAAVRPTFAIMRGMDRVKLPALVTLGVGAANAIVSWMLLSFTDLGYYAAALSLSVFSVGKSILFEAPYAARLMNMPSLQLIREMLPGICNAGICIICSIIYLGYAFRYGTFVWISGVIIIMTIYSISAYYIWLDAEEKVFIKSLVKRNA